MQYHIQNNQLNPLSPSDMYGKIWVAFREMEEDYHYFIDYLWAKSSAFEVWDTLTSAPDLASAMKEYFKSKEGE